MRRNFDLVRQLLLKVEECDFNNGVGVAVPDGPSPVEDFSPNEVYSHMEIMGEAGLVEFNSTLAGGSILRMTWIGHEFLDTVRDESRWAKTKDKAKELGSQGFEFILSIGKELLKEELKKRVGIL